MHVNFSKIRGQKVVGVKRFAACRIAADSITGLLYAAKPQHN